MTQRLEREAVAWLQERGLEAIYHRLSRLDVPHLVQAVQAERGGLLVLVGRRLPLPAEAIEALLNKIDCPILLLKSLEEGSESI